MTLESVTERVSTTVQSLSKINNNAGAFDSVEPFIGGCMATSRVTVVPMKMAQMKAAQVPKPGADFEIVERAIPEAGADKFASRCRLVASATATCYERRRVARNSVSPRSRP